MRIPSLPTVAALALLGPSLAPASEAMAQKAGCTACHALDKKSVGPSWKDIAARYKGDAKAPALLAARVRQGSQGVWGAVPMVPVGPAQISDAQLKSVLDWALKR
ncbi:MAG: c-type cytochrome [Comamonadaceae bacterium]|nr:c-type cytochrome [Comamonadaceae bacterium]